MRHDKILDWETLAGVLEGLRKSGKTIVFTNGCFDLIHAGHVRYLKAAKAEGDILVLGMNSDESVRMIKGELRPITPQEQRAEVLAALADVDYVTLFEEPDPLNLILCLKPDVLVKGADWAEDQIVGADAVKSRGGRVKRVQVVEGASTSGIIQRILERYRA
jgi:D-beta-D-heptose 7-phosphate kinase/D-beta-D-heptose 1-phosphate adenosyltransferase